MASLLPLRPSDTNYRLVVPIDGATYVFYVRWNPRDGVDSSGKYIGAHYIDMRDSSEQPVALNMKVVLGANLGRTSSHRFFKKNVLRALDTSKNDLDAGYDDLGGRVVVLRTPMTELGGS